MNLFNRQSAAPKEDRPVMPEQDNEQPEIPHFIELGGLTEVEIQVALDAYQGGELKYRRARAHRNF